MAELFKFPREGKGSHRKHFDRYNAIFFYPRLKFFTNIFSPVQGHGLTNELTSSDALDRYSGFVVQLITPISESYSRQ